MLKLIKYCFYSLVTLGLIDFFVQVISQGQVKIIHRILDYIIL